MQRPSPPLGIVEQFRDQLSGGLLLAPGERSDSFAQALGHRDGAARLCRSCTARHEIEDGAVPHPRDGSD